MKPTDSHMLQVPSARVRQQLVRQRKTVFDAVALRLALLPICAAFAACIGCRMSAPIYVWKSPPMDHGGAMTIAVGPIGGDLLVAEKLDQAMIASRPQRIG